jgi:hypothetical protein
VGIPVTRESDMINYRYAYIQTVTGVKAIHMIQRDVLAENQSRRQNQYGANEKQESQSHIAYLLITLFTNMLSSARVSLSRYFSPVIHDDPGDIFLKSLEAKPMPLLN